MRPDLSYSGLAGLDDVHLWDASNQALDLLQVQEDGIGMGRERLVDKVVELAVVNKLLGVAVVPVLLEGAGEGNPRGPLFIVEVLDDAAPGWVTLAGETRDLVFILGDAVVYACLLEVFHELADVVSLEPTGETVLGRLGKVRAYRSVNFDFAHLAGGLGRQGL